MSTDPVIQLEHAEIFQNDLHLVLKDVNLNISRGEFVYLIGRVGSGKTSLIRTLNAELPLKTGHGTVAGFTLVKIKNSLRPKLRRKLGIVFQDFRLLDNINVFENVAIALRIRGVDEREVKSKVFDALKLVSLRHKTDSYPTALSGGEQQRVAIARAIVSEPVIILADEPTGNVDPDTSAGIIRTFKEINARGTTILLATHNRELFRNSGKRVLKLDFGNFAGEEIG